MPARPLVVGWGRRDSAFRVLTCSPQGSPKGPDGPLCLIAVRGWIVEVESLASSSPELCGVALSSTPQAAGPVDQGEAPAPGWFGGGGERDASAGFTSRRPVIPPAATSRSHSFRGQHCFRK